MVILPNAARTAAYLLSPGMHGHELIVYNAGDIQPPTRKKVYKNNIEMLLEDWECGSHDLVKYQGKPIPIRLWREIFRRSHSAFWWTYTKNYSKQRLVIGIYKWYSTPDAFWADFSRRVSRKNWDDIWERLPWKGIVEKAWEKRRVIDEEAATEARARYYMDFNEVFTYREGSKTKVFLSPRKIASKYRSLCGSTMPWDNKEVEGEKA
ncbi:hypothetical protein K469DRAFT_750474 [Zopfia rhizophila CBS 207.26]|uniref:Uncharacterized protein n=1 Tax=Zopfia rhizophila CBS 207.26 TaxID=1314779 RepID=A0A6A6E4A7_9PEZI|nr:hypothetical protein K469DRAFT_750474 [Zopfia rhizophila CBS 207.26]